MIQLPTQSPTPDRVIPTVYPDSPRARRTDPLTSHEAADATSGSVAASQAAVRDILASVMFPLTDTEIIRLVNREAHVFSESRLRTARHELVEAGVVTDAGTVKPEGARTRSTVWTLKDNS